MADENKIPGQNTLNEPKMPAGTPVMESTSVAPQAQLTPKTTESTNVFTELFGNDESAKKTGVMDTVINQEAGKKKSFFSSKPPVKSLQKLSKEKKVMNPGRAILQFSMLCLIFVIGFGVSQNSGKIQLFGVNPAKRAVLAQEQVDTTSSENIVQRGLISIYLLDEYSGLADKYFYNLTQSSSEFVSSNKRASIKEENAKIKMDMIAQLEELKKTLKEESSQDYKKAATDAMQAKIDELSKKSKLSDDYALIQEKQDYETAKRLLQSKDYRQTILKLDLEKASDDELKKVWKTFNNEINQSVLSIVSAIRESRVQWSTIFGELESVIKTVDPLFNTEFTGSFSINDVSLNKASNSVTVSGTALTDDTKTFTLVANLLDALEKSEFFEKTEDRSFSKSNLEATYQSNFSVGMSITDQSNEGQK